MEHQLSGQIAHQQQQVMNDHMTTATPQPVESTNPTGTYLDHLNDYCLLEIFSKNSMTPMDLCSLAETCKRFKRITQLVFPKTLCFQSMINKYRIEKKHYRWETLGSHDIERIFKHFGSCLVTLLSYDAAPDLLAKYCRFGTLKELEICRVFDADVAVKLKPVFQQLQKLSMIEVHTNCGANVFAKCGSLTELRLDRVHEWNSWNGILRLRFPKLRLFKLLHQDGNDDFGCLLKFIKRHRTLKSLGFSIRGCVSVGDFVRKLGNICSELEELEIGELHALDGIQGAMLDFSNFHNLKRLVLRYRNHRFGTGTCRVELQNLKSLEALKIVGVFDSKQFWKYLPLLQNLRELDVNCQTHVLDVSEKIPFSSLTQLTKLRVVNYRHAIVNLVDLIRNLTNLEELEADERNLNLSEKKFFEIVELVKGRKNVLTLTCRCHCEFSSELSKIRNKVNFKVRLVLVTKQWYN